MYRPFNFSLVLFYLTLFNTGFSQDTFEKIDLVQLPIGNFLTWSVVEGENYDYFIIEKATDGTDFKALIKFDKWEENNDSKSFSFLDVHNNELMSHYRIKRVEQEDTYSYSKTIRVTKKFENNLDVLGLSYPSKNNDVLSIHLYSLKQGPIDYTLEDEKENLYTNETVLVIEGENRVDVPFSNLAKGTYMIKLKMGTEMEQILVDYEDTNSVLVLKEKKN